MASHPTANGAEQSKGFRRLFESARVVAEALLIALVVRTFLFEPFYIPSSSMEPTLLVGDYLFVSKFSYGYSRYSLPLSPPLISGRILASLPERGDVVVFRNGSEDLIKRVIGLPGDRIQLAGGLVLIDGYPVERHRIANFVGRNPCRSSPPSGPPVQVEQWDETLPNGVNYHTLQCANLQFPDTTDTYVVPPDHFFMMGDNRENSDDSRFPDVGYVAFDKLIGPARIIFFSIVFGSPAWEVWHWQQSVRWSRLLTIVH